VAVDIISTEEGDNAKAPLCGSLPPTIKATNDSMVPSEFILSELLISVLLDDCLVMRQGCNDGRRSQSLTRTHFENIDVGV
jgi:hypothetical protein